MICMHVLLSLQAAGQAERLASTFTNLQTDLVSDNAHMHASTTRQ